MKYFSFQEMERSETAYRHGIDNTAPEGARRNIAVLVDRVLDPLREAWGKPLTVTSGYRCQELNRIVGARRHRTTCGAWLPTYRRGNRVENRRLFQLVLDLKLPFTQLIDEKNFAWVHISLDPADVKRQVLRL